MRYLLVVSLAALSLTACAPVQPLSEYKPVIDPAQTSSRKFDRDLGECRQIAIDLQAEYKDRAAKEAGRNILVGVLAGVAVGAIAGNNTGYQNDYILTGAAAGALGGAGSGDYGRDLVEYGPRRVVDRCMANRGYQILNDVGRG
ncbi:glycine zipper family protein [Rhodovulum sulfidophilum]|uniref:glycine zipper family protein n=1 Tax=Rhodovulum sulfidophilum TaxID=35806 RepID=UPI0013895D2E|nr:glycine zipper family protein [Rhodovulum sulfidophilum]NDK35258.1 glycine zipper family protein [Rhodovulum sulfidophilum]